jgi:hypothetical protein
MKKKNKVNKVRFFNISEKTLNFVPEPGPASKFMPAWYKKQPGNVDENMLAVTGQPANTVKKCMPIFDAMTGGYIITLPMDIYVDASNPDKLDKQIPAAMGAYKAEIFATHDRKQYSEYPIDEEIYHRDLLRIFPFWVVGTSEGVSSLFIQPLHRDQTPLFALSGIIDTDQYPSDGHLSFMVRKGFKGIIPQGTPLVQVFPFKRESFEMEFVDQTETEEYLMKKRMTLRSSFSNSYKNKFRTKKEWN